MVTTGEEYLSVIGNLPIILEKIVRIPHGREIHLNHGITEKCFAARDDELVGRFSMTTYAPAYSISKAALNAITVMLAAALPDAKVNCVDPGWVRTDMGGQDAPKSAEEGAATIVWLATLPPGGPTGGFFRDRKRIAW